MQRLLGRLRSQQLEKGGKVLRRYKTRGYCVSVGHNTNFCRRTVGCGNKRICRGCHVSAGHGSINAWHPRQIRG